MSINERELSNNKRRKTGAREGEEERKNIVLGMEEAGKTTTTIASELD